ncbi:MAG: hypothetical protein NZT61_03745 [Deltaproteobacteria bacterium]|nr:hypothetical protein [Deltaproteobacteria bacterium]
MNGLHISQLKVVEVKSIAKLQTVAVSYVQENFRNLVEQGRFESDVVTSLLSELGSDRETAGFIWGLWKDAAVKEISMREQVTHAGRRRRLIESEIEILSEIRRGCLCALGSSRRFIQVEAWELLRGFFSWPRRDLIRNESIINDLLSILDDYPNPEFIKKLMDERLIRINEFRGQIIRILTGLGEPPQEVLDFLEKYFRKNFPVDKQGRVKRPTLSHFSNTSYWELDRRDSLELGDCVFVLGINQRLTFEELCNILLMLEPPVFPRKAALVALLSLNFKGKLSRAQQNQLIDIIFYALLSNTKFEGYPAGFRMDLNNPFLPWPDKFIERLKYFFWASKGNLREHAFDLLVSSNNLSFEEYLGIFRHFYVNNQRRVVSRIVYRCLCKLGEKAVESGDSVKIQQAFDALRSVLVGDGVFYEPSLLIRVCTLSQSGHLPIDKSKELLTYLFEEAYNDLFVRQLDHLEPQLKKFLVILYFCGIGQEKITPEQIVNWLQGFSEEKDEELWQWILRHGVASNHERLVSELEEALFASFNPKLTGFVEWRLRLKFRNMLALVRRFDPKKFVIISETLLQQPELLWGEVVEDMLLYGNDKVISTLETLLTSSETSLSVKNVVLEGIMKATRTLNKGITYL